MRFLPFFVGAALAAARGRGQAPPLQIAAAVAAADCAAPTLKVESSSPTPSQGGIVVVTLTSSLPLASAALTDGKRRSPLEAVAPGSGRLYRGLWGVDFESDVGARRVRLEATGLCKDARTTSWQLKVVDGRFPVQKLTVDPAFVEPPPSELARIERDREKVARLWAAAPTERRWDRRFLLPVEAPLRENFGAKRVFNGKPRSRHNGVDLAAATGAPVTAPAPATVILAEDLYYSGGTVILDHGAGLYTTYFHLSRIDVKVGDLVAAGDALGAVGATGRATGPHLHWGARLGGARVNPLGLLKLPAWPAPESIRGD